MSTVMNVLMRLPIGLVQGILIFLTLVSSLGTSLGEAYFPYTQMAVWSLVSLVVSTVVYSAVINLNAVLPAAAQIPLFVLILLWTVGNAILTYFIYLRMFASHGIVVPLGTQMQVALCFFGVIGLIFYVKQLLDPYVSQLPVVH